MYAVNNARTGIFEFDSGIERYMHYLASLNTLPMGKYVLAGGAIRSLFDNTTVKDLDLYILGTESEHEMVLNNFPNHMIMELDNPFSQFKIINMTKDFVTEYFIAGNGSMILRNANLTPISEGGSEVQIISLKYDLDYPNKKPEMHNIHERHANRFVSSIDEVLNSFDLTICKAGIEFTVLGDVLAVSEVKLPASFLTHIALRKMAFSPDRMTVPQQLCSVKRFYKYLKYGYIPDEVFFAAWHARVKANPHILSMSYNNDDL